MGTYLAQLAARAEMLDSMHAGKRPATLRADEYAAVSRGGLVACVAQAVKETAHGVERRQRQRDTALLQAFCKLRRPQAQEYGGARIGGGGDALLRVRVDVDAYEGVLRVVLPHSSGRRCLDEPLTLALAAQGLCTAAEEALLGVNKSLYCGDGVAHRSFQMRRKIKKDGQDEIS
jgi:hypothetical protein